MRFRLKEGAIIGVTLGGATELQEICGKVEKVLPDELVLVQQDKIFRISDCKSNTYKMRVKSYTADDEGCVMHIRRKLIVAWRYLKYDEVETIGEVIVKGDDELEQYKLNYYVDGFCYGKGRDCSDLVETT